MKIVYVVDTVQPSNGVATSALRSAAMLRAQGHQVRVVATDGDTRRPQRGWMSAAAPDPQDQFIAQPWKIPVVEAFARPQSFTFAKPDRALLSRAYDGADVVHLWLATPFGRAALTLAREIGLPVSAGFHVQPENISYNVWLGRQPFTIDFIYRQLRDRFYDDVPHVHCPSRFIAEQLRAHDFKAKTHVISNGVTDKFSPGHRREPWRLGDQRPFKVMSVGRFSPEKKQGLLIRAINRSRYKDQVSLQLAGRGPNRRYLQLLAKALRVPLQMGFLSQEDLIASLQAADLYVHPADAEIEAVACLEAVACGLVPVIAESPRSAASQFALDARSLFETNEVKALAEAIDWWIEHPDDRSAMGPRYAASAQNYSMSRTVELLEHMLRETIEDA